MTMTEPHTADRKRPVLVWGISIFFFLSAVWTLLSLYLIWSGAIPLEPAQRAYFDKLTPLDNALSVISALLNLAGAVALFLLRKIARDLFLSALVLGTALTIWQAATRGWLEALGGPGMIGALVGYALLAAVCIYAWHLRNNGVLR